MPFSVLKAPTRDHGSIDLSEVVKAGLKFSWTSECLLDIPKALAIAN